jgi:hypothetical protein
MAQIIQIKRSTTPGNTPGPLQTGELAINVTDGSLFFGSATTVHNSFKFGALDITNDLTVSGSTRIKTILEIGSDTDKFLMSDSGNIKYVTGANLKSYIGAESGTVTSVDALTLGTTGTDLSSTVVDSTTTPVITLNVPTASASNRGALSSTDWTTFNNKTTNLGTVTSVDTAGTVNGITLTGGDITSSGTITLGGTLGSIANSQLTNSTISLGGVSLSLGGSDTTPAFNLSDATAYPGDSSLVTTGTITSGVWNSNRLFTQQGEDLCTTMADYVTFGGEDATECGQVYYYNGSAWELANADDVGTGTKLLAIAMGETVADGMMIRGMVGLAAASGNAGDVLYLSETDGEITNVAPTTPAAVVRVVGYALSDSPQLWFNPDNTWVELT